MALKADGDTKAVVAKMKEGAVTRAFGEGDQRAL
jgi:hypothetical protein